MLGPEQSSHLTSIHVDFIEGRDAYSSIKSLKFCNFSCFLLPNLKVLKIDLTPRNPLLRECPNSTSCFRSTETVAFLFTLNQMMAMVRLYLISRYDRDYLEGVRQASGMGTY